MSNSKGQVDRDCTEKCKSAQHGDNLCSVISKRGVTDADLCSYIRWKCSACGQIYDSMGRTVLHFASSCGRTQLVKWLVRKKTAQINAKDLESGYTALHRSIFYGQINTAIALIKLGANVSILDHNNLTPLEHAMKDRNVYAQYTLSSSCQVYVWGTNTNYTLGTGSQHSRQYPDLHDTFHKKYTNLSIAQVCMAKFHCILVTRDGRVFSCGHGHGGRLGLNSEKTVLIPQELQFNSSGLPFVCVKASIGRDHSLFLSEAGQVWSCGLNTHHILGIKPAPSQLLIPRPLTEIRAEIKGICTGRFHSVAWSSTAVYTWGLHAGQLGHDRTTNKTYVTPKMVSFFSNQDIKFVYVAASDGATVVSTDRGDIYVLHEYQYRRIASKLLNIEKIEVVGGHLNSKVSNDVLIEKGGNELKVLVLLTTGNLLLWQESWPQLSRCIYNLNRPLIVKDAVLSRTELFFVTEDGEAFKGECRPRKKKLQENAKNVNKSAFHEFLDKNECQIVKVTKFPYIHRAMKIQCDLKGRNFSVIQNVPHFLLLDIPEVSASNMHDDMMNLLNNSNEMDAIHDIVFKVSGHIFPVHRYVITLKSEPLESLIESNSPENVIELTNINPILFKQILLYVYTGTCDILKCGECSMEVKNICTNKNKITNYSDDMIDDNISTFEYSNKKQKSKTKNKEINKTSDEVNDPVRLLQQAAKRFGIKSLYKKLDNLIYVNGVVQIKTNIKVIAENIKFDRSVLKHLYDVTIKSKSGAEILAHKCVLAGRLEYFNNLFAVRWNESSTRSVISLPIAYSVLEQVIDFLYTDESKDLENSDDIDHITNVLIVSDQLFIERLKEICEVAISKLLTLRNTSQILLFASIYNAGQLKRCCMEFICLNLSAMLESKHLESLDDDILNDLTKYYCNWNPILCKRVITPYSDAPCDEDVKSINELYPVNVDDSDQENIEKKTSKLNSRRKLRSRKISSSENVRNKSSSELNLDNSFENNTSFSETFEEESIEKKTDKKWVKILSEKEKHQKIVQNRIRAIASAKDETDSEKTNYNNLTKLVSKTKSIPKNESTYLQKSTTMSSPILTRSPILNTSTSEFNFNVANSPPSYDIPIQKAQKLSQKHRKKLAISTMAKDLDEINKKAPSWNALVMSKENNSFADIMQRNLRIERDTISSDLNASNSNSRNPWQRVEVPSPVTSPETKQNFVDIIADERKQREHWTKMRARPLFFTQMEDKAISDLERFYSVDQVSDEYITIHKVEKGTVAAPIWVQANAKH